MDNIVCAPVIIPTLCRHDRFHAGLESLKRNTWAEYTDVYIAVDYPARDEHWDGYNKICEYLDNGDFSVFKSFNVIKREKNFGPGFNLVNITKELIKKYERWIVAEDDIVFSTVFLEYMNKCLELYKDDDNVISVNGYSYPLNWVSDKEANIIFQSSWCSAWGIGQWRDKYLRLQDDIESGYLSKNFDKAYKTGIFDKLTNHVKNDYAVGSLGGNDNSLVLGVSDVSISIYMTYRNKYVVTPVVSETRNLGFDGSGWNSPKVKKTSCGQKEDSLNYDYSNQPIDTANSFEPCPDSVVCREENRQLLNEFMRVEQVSRIVGDIAIIVYRILGIKKYKALLKRLSPLVSSLTGKENITCKYLEEYIPDNNYMILRN